MVEPIFKERNALEIETVSQMEKVLHSLLFCVIKIAFKSFNVMYLKEAQNVAEGYTRSFKLKECCEARRAGDYLTEVL